MDVLLVEDEDAIAEPLAEALRREGFSVSRVSTGAQALLAPEPDLILLDLRLPDLDGYEVCRTLRARSRVPIIVVTARGEEVDRVIGLELGADDYVVKPFNLRELVARMRAVLRRSAPAPEELEAPIRIGSLAIDARSRQATIDDASLGLTAKEFDLLAYLATDPGKVFTRRRILEDVWEMHWIGTTKTLDVHVASLRKKLGDPTWIETVRGVGFRLRPTP